MRKIAFRAWNRKESRMVMNANVIGANEPDILEEWEFMQFTGLKDKDGKGIYEGDLVKTGGIEPLIDVVKWDKSGSWDIFGFTPPEEDIEREVIGNIYENLELLGGK